MQTMSGSSAFSGFRIGKTLARLQQLCPAITALHAHYLHFLDVELELSASEQDKTRRLLNYGHLAKQDCAAASKLFVIPRPGTISPWSSKATDIFHHSGLTKIKRVERGLCWSVAGIPAASRPEQRQLLAAELHDRMTQIVINDIAAATCLFAPAEARPLGRIQLATNGIAALEQANLDMGLALSADELAYLFAACTEWGRDPTDVEIMMFAQANSEHCRHKIFNADWIIDKQAMSDSLFDLIKKTYQNNPGKVLSAYKDNAAVIKGYQGSRFFPDPQSHEYGHHQEAIHILMKVETHNHPTTISPYPGAATGSGGEIRDEAATGMGAKPKAALCGFAVSNLCIPAAPQPWEAEPAKPDRIASALDIMLAAPIGSASYNNEFGRPTLAGYFRSFEEHIGNHVRGYHKPIMLAGGYGMIREPHVEKRNIPVDSPIIVLGGPAMLIGLGGGAASSMASGTSDQALDFASVQRDNAEIQRRCQEVIDQCLALAADNPILSIHDVGAGGLSNALPELVHASARGAIFELHTLPKADPSLSPMELWCNESQERYVLAIAADGLEQFTRFCLRERAPFAVIGKATQAPHLLLRDKEQPVKAIDMPLSVLLDRPPGLTKTAARLRQATSELNGMAFDLTASLTRVLQLPTVADKRFLITIGDRSVSGLVCRDQMVGPWQIPVADCAVTSSSYAAATGEAMAMGERAPLAISNPAASGRMAIAEAITNICASRILRLDDIAFSANWMAACGRPEEDIALFETVTAVSDLACELAIPIPVGKDSLSMNTHWKEPGTGKVHEVSAPLSVNITAFAPVADVYKSLTPQLHAEENSLLLLLDLGRGKNRLGESCLAQVYNQHGHRTPDLDDSQLLQAFFNGIQLLNETGYLLAYHDRSDGGLITCLIEMALAGRQGLQVDVGHEPDPVAFLFNEEAGAVIQIHSADRHTVYATLEQAGIAAACIKPVATLSPEKNLAILSAGKTLYKEPLTALQALWSSTSFHLQSLRDHPACAAEEYESVQDASDPGLFVDVDFALAPAIVGSARPNIGILREQGVNGHIEMAAAFARAGFTSIDIHMSDLLQGQQSLSPLQGLVACGGFSYGDVLGAGGGWAKSILFSPNLREQFAAFFQRRDSFALGVCNGCQMLSQLRELIPGTDNWPHFIRNRSEQFEARLVMVEIMASPSLFFESMAGAKLPVVVAHGEGQSQFSGSIEASHPVLRYIDNHGISTMRYPANPNGSAAGLNGFTSHDGRFTIMMPHPERVFLSKQFSWISPDWTAEESPWMQLFHNARRWLS